MRLPASALLTLAVILGCGTDPGTAGNPGTGATDSTLSQDSLHFLRASLSAPPLADRQVSFWAVRGQSREIRLMYRPASGQTDSVEFARFRVDDRTLVTDSAGQPVAQGDSLLITLSIADSLHLVTEFQPSGLVFNPSRPARLWLKFGEADPDLNHDGAVTAADTALIAQLSIWKQEHPTDATWQLVPSTINMGSLEVEADIAGFTRFAVAY
jgi:hypothetical protein